METWQIVLCWVSAVIACIVCGFYGAVYVLNQMFSRWR